MNYALRIPDYYKEDIENLKGDVSVNQFIVNALAEKISSLKIVAYLQERADKGSRKHALDILNTAPDVEPAEDELSQESVKNSGVALNFLYIIPDLKYFSISSAIWDSISASSAASVSCLISREYKCFS